MDWDRYRRAQANPIVIDRNGYRWRFKDWDFVKHRPKVGREPILGWDY